jgi:hypothetical protein
MQIDFDISRYGGVLITCDKLGDSAPVPGQTFVSGGRQWLITSARLREVMLAVWPPSPPSYICGAEMTAGDDK